MIGKLEARHAWSGGVTLNRKVDDAGVAVWPRYELQRIGGLGSLGDIDDQRRDRIGRRGELPLPALRRGKTVTYEGEILARTLLELRTAEQALLAAFDPVTYAGAQEGRMDVTAHPDAVGLLPGLARFFRGRPLSCSVEESQGKPDWRRGFAVALRMADPRVYAPTLLGPYSTGAFAAGVASVVVANPGTVETDPTIAVTGPTAATWSVENVTTGRRLEFDNFALVAGETATIDFAARTVVLAGADRADKLDLLTSDWWNRGEPGLASGNNTIELRSATSTGATVASVSFYAADAG